MLDYYRFFSIFVVCLQSNSWKMIFVFVKMPTNVIFLANLKNKRNIAIYLHRCWQLRLIKASHKHNAKNGKDAQTNLTIDWAKIASNKFLHFSSFARLSQILQKKTEWRRLRLVWLIMKRSFQTFSPCGSSKHLICWYWKTVDNLLFLLSYA